MRIGRMLRRLRRQRWFSPFVVLLAVAITLPPGFGYAISPISQRIFHHNSSSATQDSSPPIRVLRLSEMKSLKGKGPYRFEERCGKFPWTPFYRSINLATGNLMVTATDLSYPSRGMNIACTRTYNSHDDKVGPFGKGWAFSYDMALYTDPQDPVGTLDRKTWNGTVLPYQVDADGLVTPPVFVHDKTARTKWMVRAQQSDGSFSQLIYVADLEGNIQGDEPPPPTGEEVSEFALEFTRRSKDGTITTYYAFGRDSEGLPTGWYKPTRIEDRNGNAVVFEYGLEVTYPDGSKDCLLTKIIDTVGREVQISWANVGSSSEPKWRIVAITDPIGRVWQYEYDSEGNLWKVTDPAGRTTTYGYTSVSGSEGIEEGLLASITSPMGKTTQFSYLIRPAIPSLDPWCRQDALWVDQVIEPSGYKYRLEISWMAQTDSGWIINVVRSATGWRTYWQCSLRGTVFWDWTAALQPNAFRVWDVAFNLTVASEGGPAGTSAEMGQPQQVTNYRKMTYDAIIDYGTSAGSEDDKVVNPGQGNITKIEEMRSLTDIRWLVTTFEYWDENKFHQQKAVIDPMGRRTETDYYPADDPNPGNRGNVKKVVDAKGGVTTFEYDQYGQKIKMTDPEGRVWRYEYDQYGNLRKLIYPDGSYTETSYDLIGRPVQIRDRKGQVTTITYNAVGQPVRVEYSDGSYVEYAYDGDGQVIAVTESGRGTTSYTYDNAGRLIAVTDPEMGTVQYEYDLFGMRTKIVYPNGWQVRYEYAYDILINQSIMKGENDEDSIPALWKVVDPLGYFTNYFYTILGQIQKQEIVMEKDVNENPTKKLIAEYVWDTENMLLSLDWKVIGSSGEQRVRKFAYTYDDLRNRTSQEITESDGTVKVESYEYDELNRLVRVTYPDGLIQSYTFDGVGNRLTKTEQFPNGTVKATSYTYNALNQLVSLTDENGTRVFSYDENGNCVNDGKRLYEWDVQNRLVRVIVPNEGEVRFRYCADGMRVEKQVVGGLTTKYVYDGQTVIGEIRSDGTKRWYVLGAMGYICRIDEGANGEILARDYFVYDGLGSCRALVSSNGLIVAKYDYDVYGSVRGQEGQRANNFKYVAQIGHPTDEETGLIYMRARYYDPEIGRFISEDPSGHGVNWYLYADGNPVNKVDVDGRKSLRSKPDWLINLAQAFASGDYDSVALYVQMIAEYLLGIDKTTAEAIGDLVKKILTGLELGTGKRAAKKVIEKTEGLWEQVIIHAKKILDNPNSDAVKNWRSEIENWLKTIHRRVVE